MKEYHITIDELKILLSKQQYLTHGGNGIIFKYNNETLLKIYYEKYFQNYNNKTIERLIKEIEDKIEKEELRKKLLRNYIDSITTYTIKQQKLSITKSKDLIKGILIIDGLVIGTFLKNYKDYEIYEESNFTKKENIIILNKITKLIEELINSNIYPTDIKNENILVNKTNLDVKLIDLDDKTTVYSNESNIKYSYLIAQKAINIRKKTLK